MLTASDLVATARGQVENLPPAAVAIEVSGEGDVLLVMFGRLASVTARA
jgi:hypothetical protein